MRGVDKHDSPARDEGACSVDAVLFDSNATYVPFGSGSFSADGPSANAALAVGESVIK